MQKFEVVVDRNGNVIWKGETFAKQSDRGYIQIILDIINILFCDITFCLIQKMNLKTEYKTRH